MKRRRILQIGMSIGSILIIIGVTLFGYVRATEDERNAISVNLDETVKTEGVLQKNVDFEYLTLVPGESCEYTLSFGGEEANTYDVTLDYYAKEEDKEHTLKNFAYIRIESGDKVLCDSLLATAFESEPISFSVDLTTGENTELRLVYYLPLDVGNEAQNAEAFFGLKITASNENEGGAS